MCVVRSSPREQAALAAFEAKLRTHALLWDFPNSRQNQITESEFVCKKGYLIMQALSYIGIDISKATLDVDNMQKHLFTCTNDAKDFQRIITACHESQAQIIAIEATGGYERELVNALLQADLPVAVVQPKCARHFALSTKTLAKTDKIDCRMLAQFAAATNPRLYEKPSENVQKLRALYDRRKQVIDDRVRETGRLEACPCTHVATRIQEHIKLLREEEATLQELIEACIKEDQDLHGKQQELLSTLGVGPQTATALLTHLPELGTVNRQHIAALAGIAPYDRSSGAWTGRSSIKGGRHEVRCALYMAALCATRHDPVIKVIYQRLVKKGKPKKVAIIACARKLLVHLNSMLRDYRETKIALT